MNEDEQIHQDDIHEAIGLAATYLMNTQMPVKPGSLMMVLRAQSIMATGTRQKKILEAARQRIMERVTHTT